MATMGGHGDRKGSPLLYDVGTRRRRILVCFSLETVVFQMDIISYIIYANKMFPHLLRCDVYNL